MRGWARGGRGGLQVRYCFLTRDRWGLPSGDDEQQIVGKGFWSVHKPASLPLVSPCCNALPAQLGFVGLPPVSLCCNALPAQLGSLGAGTLIVFQGCSLCCDSYIFGIYRLSYYRFTSFHPPRMINSDVPLQWAREDVRNNCKRTGTVAFFPIPRTVFLRRWRAFVCARARVYFSS